MIIQKHQVLVSTVIEHINSCFQAYNIHPVGTNCIKQVLEC